MMIFKLSFYTYLAYGLAALAVLAFILLAWRDLVRLVRAPKGLGTGVGRIWALARVTLSESFAARAWMVPVLWLGVVLIIGSLVRTHGDDMREWIAALLMILLRGQEYILLILLLVLACFSLPRERERRTIITTASKPISRLELYLGKVVGFSVLAALLLFMMFIGTYVYLLIADQMGRKWSTVQYQAAVTDYDQGKLGVGPPPEGKRLDAERGFLQAGNYITAAGGMQIAGMIEYSGDQTARYLKGSSSEKILTRFASLWSAPGAGQQAPAFYFNFVALPLVEGMPLPDKIKINVSLQAENNPSQTGIREHTLELEQRRQTGFYETLWEPDPEGLFSYSVLDASGKAVMQRDYGRVRLEISCPTERVYLKVRENIQRNDSNVLALGMDPTRGPDTQVPLMSPHMIGFEKRDLYQVEGPPKKEARPQPLESMRREEVEMYCQMLEVASWRFRQADLVAGKVPLNPDGTFTLSMLLDLDKTANNEWPTSAAVMVYNQTAQDKPYLRTTIVAEKRLTEIKIPAEALTGGGDMFVDIRCLTPGHWIGANNKSVRLAQADSPFIWNLAKSEMIILAECILLVVVAVAASVRLGGAVAILVTMVCYVMGNIFPFVQEIVTNGADSLLNASDKRDLAGNWFYETMSGVYAFVIKIVYVIVSALPDFRIYQPLEYITQWRNMPIMTLLGVLAGTFFFAVPFVALAYLLARKQELA